MEEGAVSNVRELRPGTGVQTDREREFVEYLIQKLRDFRDMGVKADSIMFAVVGEQSTIVEGEPHNDPDWIGVCRMIGDDRATAPTICFMGAFIQKYVHDCLTFADD